jgi:hypothetical protein
VKDRHPLRHALQRLEGAEENDGGLAELAGLDDRQSADETDDQVSDHGSMIYVEQ